jgi:hypothetical protein
MIQDRSKILLVQLLLLANAQVSSNIWDVQDILIYMRCVDILILACRLYRMVFSMPMTEDCRIINQKLTTGSRNPLLKLNAMPLHAPKALGGTGGIAATPSRPRHTRWGWVVSVTPRPRFSPGERTSDIHCTGSWMRPEPVWTQRFEEKSFRLYRGSNLDRPARSQTLYWLSYPAHCSTTLLISL